MLDEIIHAGLFFLFGFLLIYSNQSESEESMNRLGNSMILTGAYDTGDFAELKTAIPCTKGGKNERFHSILSVRLHNINPGELFWINGYQEVTNNNGHSVSVVSKLIFTNGKDSVKQALINDQEADLTEGGGRNLIPNVHHDVVVKQGIFIATRYYGARNINLIIRCTSSSANNSTRLTIEQDSGRLLILRFGL